LSQTVTVWLFFAPLHYSLKGGYEKSPAVREKRKNAGKFAPTVCPVLGHIQSIFTHVNQQKFRASGGRREMVQTLARQRIFS
jgi:hypothetical protein